MDIISRAAAGLPAPPSTLTRHTGPWPGISWHHTGGSYTTWRAIYDWQVINRPPAKRLPYIGYSYGIARGRVTELRGWSLRPAGDHRNANLQVCFMGTWDSRLPPAEDLAVAREFVAWAEARNGAPLPGISHRDVWPPGHEYSTDCPGDALHAWLAANIIERDDDMTPEEHNNLVATDARVRALINNEAATSYQIPGEKTRRSEPNGVHRVLATLTADVAVLKTAVAKPVDMDELATRVAAKLTPPPTAEQIAAALVRQLGGAA